MNTLRQDYGTQIPKGGWTSQESDKHAREEKNLFWIRSDIRSIESFAGLDIKEERTDGISLNNILALFYDVDLRLRNAANVSHELRSDYESLISRLKEKRPELYSKAASELQRYGIKI